MDLKIKVDLRKHIPEIGRQAKSILMETVEALVKETIDAYMSDLELHMGTISGGGPYSEGNIRWSALDPASLKEEGTFWYESGKLKHSLVVNVSSSADGVSAALAVADSEAYNELLWNELGFTAANGNLIRRPLFFPLADEHLEILRTKLLEQLSGMRLKLRLEIR